MDSIEDALKYQQIRDFGFNEKEISFLDLMSKPEEEICTFLPIFYQRSNLLETVNSAQRHILSDKIAAQHFLDATGITTPTLIGVWHPIFGLTADGRPMTTTEQLIEEFSAQLKNVDHIDLIFKPRAGGCGRDIVAATIAKAPSEDITAIIDDKPEAIDVLIESLPEDPFSFHGETSQGWVIQHRVKQHPDLAYFNSSSLNSIRIGTFITRPQGGDTGEPEVLMDYACLRVGRAGSSTDNGTTGGLLVDIDIETGTLNRGRYILEFSGAYADEHPDSKLPFAGHKVPYWEEAIELCLRAAKTLPSVRSVGWDVAIAEDGPLILEGNSGWATLTPQAHDQGYLTPERRAMYESSGDPMPSTQLPPRRALPGQSKQSWALYKLRKKMGV
ncbi:hypothetical protein ROA7450_02638 [Roseovarius albus]|uniref:Alpha-L-glutamate ligase-related protein ATP-grasp domain-containing protein n=1 Tax=Roseovarius albus TaxID=1247867 RepID=A0A1X6ZIW5_9RHOB|nr:sugar-transfer associated ATP-grasp domain-containing protein [Roseovarius albus]SLN52492.1 hypothetical protein ROA7450_02638 [Roseovarius albus]